MLDVNKLCTGNHTPIEPSHNNNRQNQISFRENLAADSFESSNNKNSNTPPKMGLFSALGLTALGALAMIKNHNANMLKKAQQLFKDMFIRDDITIDETKAILKRYKDLRKIKDKNEYISALFEETRKNFNLGKELKLEFWDLPVAVQGGGNFCLTDTIALNKNWPRQNLENAVFHELRHAKQDYLAINYDLDKFLQSNGIMDEKEKAHIIPYLQRKCGLTNFSKDNVPPEYYDYVENCYKGYSGYRDIPSTSKSAEEYKLYRDNFLEKDAWDNANKITRFLYNFELK